MSYPSRTSSGALGASSRRTRTVFPLEVVPDHVTRTAANTACDSEGATRAASKELSRFACEERSRFAAAERSRVDAEKRAFRLTEECVDSGDYTTSNTSLSTGHVSSGRTRIVFPLEIVPDRVTRTEKFVHAGADSGSDSGSDSQVNCEFASDADAVAASRVVSETRTRPARVTAGAASGAASRAASRAAHRGSTATDTFDMVKEMCDEIKDSLHDTMCGMVRDMYNENKAALRVEVLDELRKDKSTRVPRDDLQALMNENKDLVDGATTDLRGVIKRVFHDQNTKLSESSKVFQDSIEQAVQKCISEVRTMERDQIEQDKKIKVLQDESGVAAEDIASVRRTCQQNSKSLASVEERVGIRLDLFKDEMKRDMAAKLEAKDKEIEALRAEVAALRTHLGMGVPDAPVLAVDATGAVPAASLEAEATDATDADITDAELFAAASSDVVLASFLPKSFMSSAAVLASVPEDIQDMPSGEASTLAPLPTGQARPVDTVTNHCKPKQPAAADGPEDEPVFKFGEVSTLPAPVSNPGAGAAMSLLAAAQGFLGFGATTTAASDSEKEEAPKAGAQAPKAVVQAPGGKKGKKKGR